MGVSKVNLNTNNSVSGVLNTSKRCFAGINSIIEEGLKAKKKKVISNPLKKSNEERINFLQNAYRQAVALNIKARNAYRNLKSRLSGMIKITSNQQADLNSKRITYGETNLNEDLLLGSLRDAQHSQAIFYNV